MKALALIVALGVTAVLLYTGRGWVRDSVSAGRNWVRDKIPVGPETPPVASRATLGVHTLVGHEDQRSPALARTPPLQTSPGGSTLIAIVAGYIENHTPPRDNRGNDWQPLGSPVVYEGYEGRFDVAAYVVRNAHGGPGHRVEVTKTRVTKGELTMPVVEVRDGILSDVSQVYAPQGTSLTVGAVRTTGPAILVAFWWGDGREQNHRAVPGDGFRLIEQFTMLPENSGVQCAVAVREVNRAGEYSITWETTPAQGAVLWLFAFERRTPTVDGKDSSRD